MTEVELPAEKRERPAAEKLLLPAALIIAVLFDRLVFAPFLSGAQNALPYVGAFWLCYLAVFYAFYRKRLLRDKVLWYVAVCSAGLCAWNFVNAAFYGGGNQAFGGLTFLVVPCVLMAHAQMAAGGYKLKEAGAIAEAWVFGWVIKPFSGLPALFGAAASLVTEAPGGGKSAAKRAAIGALAAALLLCVLVPLLGGADQVFGYYLGRLAAGWDLPPLAAHTVVIVIMFGLFYSFLWNVGFGKNDNTVLPAAAPIDVIICGVVLGVVVLLYLLFCGVQFTYLFAGAGLPDGMTYSAYAREGFAQTVAVCAINLLIFGVFLRFGARVRLVRGLLAGLLGLTGVMLLSGFFRLKLYIDAYGLSWLRLISAWFIIYLAAVIVLCAARMLREKLPLIALCALLLLGWYAALGYANPDGLIAWYNG